MQIVVRLILLSGLEKICKCKKSFISAMPGLLPILRSELLFYTIKGLSLSHIESVLPGGGGAGSKKHDILNLSLFISYF